MRYFVISQRIKILPNYLMNIFKIPSVILYSLNRQCYFSTQLSRYHNLKNILIKMPRDSKHIAEAQKQRVKIKQKSQKYAPGTISIQVIGSGAPGSPSAVYLFTDQSRYLFNCGEGTQRLANEHKTKITLLEHIFITRTCWQRTGGLPGLSLTLQDNGVPNLVLHGPDGLGDIFHAMRQFVILKDLRVDAPVCEDGVIHDDQVLSVQAVSFKRGSFDGNSNDQITSTDSSPDNLVSDDTDYFAHERNNVTQECFVSSQAVTKSGKSQCGSAVMSFICRLKARPGKLCLEKCVDKGVPPGPLLGQLKNGNNITLPDGTMVYAHEVRTAADPGPVFIVIDIPSEEYLEDFVNKGNIFAAHQITASSDEDMANLVLHFSPPNVMNTPAYKDFINKFASNTKHMVLNESNKLSGNIAAHRIQFQLNQLNEHIFPILDEYRKGVTSNKKIKLDESTVSDINNTEIHEENSLCEPVLSSTQFHLRPYKGLDRLNEVIVNPQEYITEASKIPGFVESLENLKRQLNHVYENEKLNRSDVYPKIVFLGTGSCIPNKTRNVSSILVHTTPNSSILMDCGEGTTGQFIRFYGKIRCRDVFKNLKAIYISHLHADHHTGLIEILQERRRLLGSDAAPVMLLAPQQISHFLQFYDKRIESIRNEYFLVANGDLLDQPLSNEYTEALGLNFISTCLVRHCRHSFGIAFEISANEPFKITYSGDTIPCEELVRIGLNSSLLIHEATMEDELLQQAQLKMHSTVSQAIEQGAKMKAKYTLLTHFSQRYSKLPRIEGSITKNIGIAFDNMEVTCVDLKYLHLLYPTLKLLFTEHCELMENKALKRAYKEQSTSLLLLWIPMRQRNNIH